MSLATILDEAARRRKSLTVYASEETDLDEQFATRNVTVVHRALPADESDPFVVLYEGEEFRGAVSLTDFLTFLTPPIRLPWDLDALDVTHRAIFDLFSDTVFTGLNRRQLLATSREFEDRALRTGHGPLHVGFQSLRAFEAQEPVYRRMAEVTDLDIHIYAALDDEADRPATPDLTFHTDPEDDVGRYWFFVFDPDDDPQHCALVAEEGEDGTFSGVWTYDRGLVKRTRSELP